jgi:uncharacterized spore protein YtfJ
VSSSFENTNWCHTEKQEGWGGGVGIGHSIKNPDPVAYILYTSKHTKFRTTTGWDRDVINIVTMQIKHLQDDKNV